MEEHLVLGLNDLEIALDCEIDKCRCNVAGLDVVGEQSAGLGGSKTLGGSYMGATETPGIGGASLPEPEAEHERQRPRAG